MPSFSVKCGELVVVRGMAAGVVAENDDVASREDTGTLDIAVDPVGSSPSDVVSGKDSVLVGVVEVGNEDVLLGKTDVWVSESDVVDGRMILVDVMSTTVVVT